jgi:hypothetical protein
MSVFLKSLWVRLGKGTALAVPPTTIKTRALAPEETDRST